MHFDLKRKRSPTIDSPSPAPFDPRWNQWPPSQDPAIRDALLAAWQDDNWAGYFGPHVEALEAELASYHGVRHALVCASGTVAVQIALRALHAPEGAEVILAGYDFPGNFRAIQDAGLFPVLADIDPRTWCLAVDQVEAALSPQTAAVVVSHLHGGLADMRALRALADRHGVAIVEDACQATGAVVEGTRAGAGGDVGVLSFGGSKLLTAGRGGALLTDRTDLYQRAKVFCERGNHAFPMSQLQAAVLLPQLARLEVCNAQRVARLKQLQKRLAPLAGQLREVGGSQVGVPGLYKHAWNCASAELCDWLLQQAQKANLPLGPGFRGFVKRPTSQARKVGPLTHCRGAVDRTLLLHHAVLMADGQAVSRLAEWMIHLVDCFQKGNQYR